MDYPLKKHTLVLISIQRKWWVSKKIILRIPKITLREQIEISRLSDSDRLGYFISKIRECGGGRDTETLFMRSPDFMMGLIRDHFIHRSEMASLPDSVRSLRTKEGVYDYDPPDGLIISTLSTEYHITPHDLLDYSMDEIGYLISLLEYKYLNEEQKKELARLKRADEMSREKENINQSVDTLFTYFDTNYGK